MIAQTLDFRAWIASLARGDTPLVLGFAADGTPVINDRLINVGTRLALLEASTGLGTGGAELAARINEAIAKAELVEGKADKSALAAEVQRAKAAEEAIAVTALQALALVEPYKDLIGAVPDRPGDGRTLFTRVMTGDPKLRPAIDRGTVEDGGELGQVLRITGTDIDPVAGYIDVAPRRPFFMQRRRSYLIQYAFGRNEDPQDPEGHAVELRLQTLGSDFRQISDVALGGPYNPKKGKPPLFVDLYIGKNGAPGAIIYTVPDRVAYSVPYFRIYGNGHETDLGSVRLYDVTFAIDGGADVTSILSQVEVMESRLRAVEALGGIASGADLVGDGTAVRSTYYWPRPGEAPRTWTADIDAPAASAAPLVLDGPYSVTTDGPGGGSALLITGQGRVTSIAKTRLEDTDVWDFTFRLARRIDNDNGPDNLPIIQFRAQKADGSNNGTAVMPVTPLVAGAPVVPVTYRISLIPGVGPDLPAGTRFVSPLIGERGAAGALEVYSVIRAPMPAIEQIDTPAGPANVLIDRDGYAILPRDSSYVEPTNGGALGAYIDEDGYAVATGTGSAPAATVVNELALRDVQNAEYSRSYTERINVGASRLLWNYNVLLGYGQSLSAAQEGWPVKSKIAMLGNLMLGNSVRGSSFGGNTFNQFGSAVLRPLIANVVANGTILTDEEVALLEPGNGAFGEDSIITFCNMLKHLWNQDRGVENDIDRLLVAASCGKGLRSIEQLSKGGSEPSNYLRLVNAAEKIKAAIPAGKTSGLFAVNYNQGEEDSFRNTSEAAYVDGILKLTDDVYTDIGQGIFGQTARPIFFMHQTGGRYAKNNPVIAQAQLRLAREYPDRIVLVSPNGAVTDKTNGHLDANGYRWQGSYAAKAAFRHLKNGRHTAPFVYRGAVIGSTILLDYCSLYALQWKAPYLGSIVVDDPAKGFVATDSIGVLSFTPELVGNRIVALRCTRLPQGTITVTVGSLSAPVSGNTFLADTDPTVSLFNYEYEAGSGDYPEANIPALVGKPYDLATFALAQSITLTV